MKHNNFSLLNLFHSIEVDVKDFKNYMNIFITGIAGFLGSHLAEECIKNGHKVFGNDNLIGGYEDNIPKDVFYSNTDCNNYEKLNEIFKLKKIDILYHCAATAYEGFSVFSPNFVTKNIFQSYPTFSSF